MTDDERDRKILLMYASAGAGHRIACEAIEQALIKEGFKGQIKAIDTLEYMPKFVANIFSRGYIWAATKVPWLWYALYESGGSLTKFKPMSPWQTSLMKVVLRRLNRLVRDEKPDYIISTYFTSSWLAGRYKRLYDSRCQAATVVTDYGLHPSWVAPNQDRYFVATDDNRIEMAYFSWYTNVDKSRIVVAGIPVMERFTLPRDKFGVRKKHNLQEDRFTVLILAGDYGQAHVEALINKLIDSKSEIQIISFARREFNLSGDLQERLKQKNIPYSAFGKIGFMEELMAAADVAITKTGGLTSSECFNSGCPIFVYLPYPGQEERNASLFIEIGAALRIYQLESLANKIDSLVASPEKHQQMVEAARKIVRPDAAAIIAKTVLSDLGAG
jgi:processive 1,2-diacylglycerol beta-glucosyltransferase